MSAEQRRKAAIMLLMRAAKLLRGINEPGADDVDAICADAEADLVEQTIDALKG